MNRHSLAGEISCESAIRERCSQAANPVTGSPGAVHPIGQPITCSKKRGLEVSSPMKEPLPPQKLTRTGGEERDAIAAVQPSAFSTSQSFVQLRAALLREYWPELVFGT